MATALVLYATRTDQTRQIANLIAEGMRMKGMEVVVENVADFDVKEFDPNRYDALLLGAATYHGEMLQSMKTLLFALEKVGLEGKVGGAFGAFGWSGEAPDRIYNTMKHIFKMRMVSGPLRLKSAALGGGLQMAHDYGDEVCRKLAS